MDMCRNLTQANKLTDGIEWIAYPNAYVRLTMPITDTNLDDQQSFILIKQGGKMRDQGYTLLFRKYNAHLSNFIISQSGFKLSTADVEEIVQDTFIKVIRNCESFKGDSPIKTWIFSIAINNMTDHFRRKKSRPTENLDDVGWKALEDDSEAMRTFDHPPSGESLEECVGRGFAEFAKKFGERAHVLSLVMEGFDTEHIASTIQRTPGATREFISQSRKRIEEFLLPCREYLSAA